MTHDELLDSMGLVKSIALKMLTADHPDFDDLVQDGFLGLMEAARKYDPTAGPKFATFAYYLIYRRMQDGARKRFGINAGFYNSNYRNRLKAKGQTVPKITHVPLHDYDRAYTPSDPTIAVDVERALATLTPRERGLLHEIYWEGLYRGDGKRPRHELQDLDGTRKLTRAGVSFVHRKALRKLAEPLHAYKVTA